MGDVWLSFGCARMMIFIKVILCIQQMARQKARHLWVGRLRRKAIVGKDVAIGAVSRLEGAEGLGEKATVYLYGFLLIDEAGPPAAEYPVVFLVGHDYLLCLGSLTDAFFLDNRLAGHVAPFSAPRAWVRQS